MDTETAPERILPDGRIVVGGWIVPPALVPYARFYHSRPAVGSLLPHTNPLRNTTLTEIEVKCDKCGTPVLGSQVRGQINNYRVCTEVRYVGECAQCARILHNTLRFVDDSRMVFQRDSKWFITARPSLWERVLSVVWPW